MEKQDVEAVSTDNSLTKESQPKAETESGSQVRRLFSPPKTHRSTKTERRGEIFIKSGPHVEIGEVEALRIIGERLEVAVPRLRDSSTSSDGWVTIEMDFVEGDTLWKLWPTMTPDQKMDIAQQLRDILVAVRSLDAPSQAISACGGSAILDLRTYSNYRGGPFANEAEFNDWITSEAHPSTPSTMRQQFRPRLRSDHRIVLSHCDLGQQNIIVRDDRVVGLVDWQYAGWFPEHWEFCKFFARSAAGRDWLNYADVIFAETYYDELFLFQFLARYQRP